MIDANRARMELLKEMGQTDFASVVLTEPLAAETPIAPLGVEQALAQRVEIKVARAALEQAKANAKFQDVSARPDLNVTYGYKRTQLPDTLDGVNTAIVSVRVTLPTTDKNQGNRIAAEAEVRRQQQLLAAVETEVRADYDGALQEYEARRAELVQGVATAARTCSEHFDDCRGGLCRGRHGSAPFAGRGTSAVGCGAGVGAGNGGVPAKHRETGSR